MKIDSLGPLPAGRPERSLSADAPGANAGRAPAAITTSTVSVTETSGAATAVTTAPQVRKDANEELKEALTKLNDSVHSQSLEFSIDEDSKRTVVKVIDTATKEVVRQMPTEEALQIAKSLDKAFGLLIRQQA